MTNIPSLDKYFLRYISSNNSVENIINLISASENMLETLCRVLAIIYCYGPVMWQPSQLAVTQEIAGNT